LIFKLKDKIKIIKINRNSLHLCSSSLNLADSGSFTFSELQSLSAIAEALGHSLDAIFVPSTYSDQRHASPPLTNFFCSSLPPKSFSGSTL